MALLVEYKCEQTHNPSIYINRVQIYLAYKEINNISMQDIKIQVREKDEQSQTQENYFVVRAHLLYVPAFNTMKNFH